VASPEAAGVKSTLTAAAWTYVAGALASVAMLLYYLSMLQNR
jgi:Zn-dependent membrane protease YugP